MDKKRLHFVSIINVQAILKKYLAKNNWQLIIFGLIHFVIYFFLFRSAIYDKLTPGFSGFMEFWQYASKVAHGLLPYRDFAVEYPPVGMVFITWPGLITSNPDVYYGVFVAEIILFDLAGLLIIAGLVKHLGLRLWQTFGLYTLSLLAIGRIISIRYDLVPATLTLFALYVFIRGHHKIAWAVLAVGTFTKIYPVVIAPIFLLYHLRNNNKRELIKGIITFTFISAVIVVPTVFLSPSGFLHSFTYQTERGLQLESTYASLLLVGKALGLTSLSIVNSFGSEGIISPMANLMAQISPFLIFFSLITIYWLYDQEQRGNTSIKSKIGPLNSLDAARIVKYSNLAILVFIITNKVVSPQYIIWLYPLIPLLIGRQRVMSWITFMIIGITTYFIYPVFYEAIIRGVYLAVALLVIRNVLLMVLVYFIVVKDRERVLNKEHILCQKDQV